MGKRELGFDERSLGANKVLILVAQRRSVM